LAEDPSFMAKLEKARENLVRSTEATIALQGGVLRISIRVEAAPKIFEETSKESAGLFDGN
jgi:hypothetical protein